MSRVPANVQIFSAADPPLAFDLPGRLTQRAASVHISEAQAGSFQPDVQFRGFAASPLLGASEGVAVYQDGVRVNEPFGDTVNWDALPSIAIGSIAVMPGSNPMFGLNALGGALSIRTKDGFGVSGGRGLVTTGSFGRHRGEAEFGGSRGTIGYYVAGELIDEQGWRDVSPSAVRRLFADVGWRGASAALNVSVTAASNDLTGNGPAPIELLEQQRSAVFTYPDTTDNDLVFVSVRGQRRPSATTALEGVAYFRQNTISALNGDAADDDAINNRSRTRGRTFGATAQMTRTTALGGRDNHFVAGVSVDAGMARFASTVEHAFLGDDRGTIGTGLFDDDEAVGVRTGSVNGGLFALNTWSWTPALAVTASARVNWTSVRLRDQIGDDLNGDHAFARLNPSAGVTYQLTPRVNVYGSYAEASRVPTPVEFTCADPEDPCRLPNAFLSDPPLDQVVARTWEAGVRRAGPRFDWTVAAFVTAAADDIIFVSSGTQRGQGHFENVSSTRRRGLETSLDITAGPVAAFATYTAQHASFGEAMRLPSLNHPLADAFDIDVAAGARLPGVPVHLGKAGVSVVRDRVAAGASIRAQSGAYLRGDESNQLPPLPAFAIVDLHGRYRISRAVSLVAQVANLFDAEAFTFGTLGDASLLGDEFEDRRFYSPGAPRAFWAGIEVRF